MALFSLSRISWVLHCGSRGRQLYALQISDEVPRIHFSSEAGLVEDINDLSRPKAKLHH